MAHYEISMKSNAKGWIVVMNSYTLANAKQNAKEIAKSKKANVLVEKVETVASFDASGMNTFDKRNK